MSHFTTVATKINDLSCLAQALDRIGLKYTQDLIGSGITIRGYRGATTKAPIAINMGTYDIGVIKGPDGMYGLEADWWGIETTTGKEEKDLVATINQAYAYQKVIAACVEAGYSVDNQVTAEDGTMTLQFCKWS